MLAFQLPRYWSKTYGSCNHRQSAWILGKEQTDIKSDWDVFMRDPTRVLIALQIRFQWTWEGLEPWNSLLNNARNYYFASLLSKINAWVVSGLPVRVWVVRSLSCMVPFVSAILGRRRSFLSCHFIFDCKNILFCSTFLIVSKLFI